MPAPEEVVYLVDITAYDPALPGTKTLRYATKGIISGGYYYEPRIKQPGNFKQLLFSDGKTSGASQIGYGEVVLINADGGLDGLINYGFDGRSIVIKTFTVSLGLVLLTSCSMEQATFPTNEVSIRIKDPQMVLNVPIQPTKYAGDNVLPAGIEGTSDIKGQPKPLTFGKVFNVTPVQVNTSKLIYQAHTGTVSIPAVYDMGVALTKGSDYTSQSDMEANAPLPGNYRVWPAGGCFRLGSAPAGQITADATEGTNASDRTPAQIAKRIATRAISAGLIYAADVTALDTANSAEVGIFIKEETMVLASLDAVLGSVGASYGFDINGNFRMQRLDTPSGTPDVTLTKDDIVSLERIASNDPGRGIPVKQVNLQYGKNYTVQASGLAGGLKAGVIQTKQSTLPQATTWSNIVFGNGIFVAFSLIWPNPIVAYSIDGSNWISGSASGMSGGAESALFVNNKFWTFGNDGQYPQNNAVANESSTGIGSWTSHGGIAIGNGYTVRAAYGAGLFVLLGNGYYQFATSPDGIIWTGRNGISAQNWNDIIFANGLFVAISNTTVVTSSDGINWSSVATPLSNVTKILFGNGLFVLINGTGTYYTSPDGTTWTARTFFVNKAWSRGIYANGRFMLMNSPATHIYMSDDGISWLLTELTGSSVAVQSIAFGNGIFCTIGSNVATSNGFITLIESSRQAWLSKEFRTVTAGPDSGVVAAHLLAPELNVTTLLVDEDAAQTEATRLLNLYKVRRDPLNVQVHPTVLKYIEPGKLVNIIYPRFGYDNGKLFKVIGINPDWERGVIILTLWG